MKIYYQLNSIQFYSIVFCFFYLPLSLLLFYSSTIYINFPLFLLFSVSLYLIAFHLNSLLHEWMLIYTHVVSFSFYYFNIPPTLAPSLSFSLSYPPHSPSLTPTPALSPSLSQNNEFPRPLSLSPTLSKFISLYLSHMHPHLENTHMPPRKNSISTYNSLSFFQLSLSHTHINTHSINSSLFTYLSLSSRSYFSVFLPLSLWMFHFIFLISKKYVFLYSVKNYEIRLTLSSFVYSPSVPNPSFLNFPASFS